MPPTGAERQGAALARQSSSRLVPVDVHPRRTERSGPPPASYCNPSSVRRQAAGVERERGRVCLVDARRNLHKRPNLERDGCNVPRSALCVQECPERSGFGDFGHSCMQKDDARARERGVTSSRRAQRATPAVQSSVSL
jgi:hypothetical protein